MKSLAPKKSPQDKSLFTSSSYALSLKKNAETSAELQSESEAIQQFTPNEFLLTRDLAYEIAGVSEDLRNKDESKSKRQVRQQISSKTDSIYYHVKTKKQLPDELAQKKIKIANLITRNANNEKLNPQNNKQVDLAVDDQKIKTWHENLRVYFSHSLKTEQKKAILSGKTELDKNSNIHDFGHLSTFMVDSQIYVDSKNNILNEPLPIKVLGFCYPDFRCVYGRGGVFWKQKKPVGKHGDEVIAISLSDKGQDKINYYLNCKDVENQVNEVLRINLLAVIEEAKKQSQPIPFILNIPNAFLAGLPTKTKYGLRKIIAEQLIILKRQYYQQVKEHISEFIVVGGQAWDADKKDADQSIVEIFKDQEYPHALTHVVDADMFSIAKALFKKGVKCPLPMMANPSHPIGCQYVDVNFTLSAFDEMLGRATGGLHRAVFDGGVLKEDQKDIRDVETDPVFQTFTEVAYYKNQTQNKNIFVDSDQAKEASGKELPMDLDNNLISQNKISLAFKCEDCNEEKIDVAEIFSSAILQATQGLDMFEGFREDPKKAKNLRDILIFANIHQGVGNKTVELTAYIEQISGLDQAGKKKLFQQARILSARFQKAMADKNMLTPRINGKEVGARLHRMASLEK